MKRILAAIDLFNSAEEVVDQAAVLAKALAAKLWVLHVASNEIQTMVCETSQFPGCVPESVSMPGNVQLARDIGAEALKHEHVKLQEISTRLRNDGVDARAILLKGDTAPLILEKANDLQVDVIILGSRRHGLLHKALLGSVSEAVIRHTRCSVMIVPAAV